MLYESSDRGIAVAMCAQSVNAHLQSDGAIVIAMCAQSVDVQQLHNDGVVNVLYNVLTARWTYGTADLQMLYIRHGLRMLRCRRTYDTARYRQRCQRSLTTADKAAS